MKVLVNFYSIIVFLSVCFGIHHSLFPLTIGSALGLSRQNYLTFSTYDTILGIPVLANNVIDSYVRLDQGFGLKDATTSLYYNGLLPVANAIGLNGGTLNLAQDLLTSNLVTFTSLGTINGNGHTVQLGANLQILGNRNQSQGYFGNVYFTGDSNIIIDAALTFSGISEINLHNNTLTFSPYGSITVAPNSTLTMKHMLITNMPNQNIVCAANSAALILQNVDMAIDTLYTFSKGSMQFVDGVTLYGTGTFVYDSPRTSTIQHAARLCIADNLCLNIAKHSTSGANPLYFADANTALIFDNCYVYIRYPGLTLPGATVSLESNVAIDMASSSTAYGLTLGDGINSNNDTFIYYAPAAISTFNSGWLMYKNVNPNGFVSLSNASEIIRNKGANTYVATNWNLSNITSTVKSYEVSPIQFAPSATVNFNNVDIEFPNSLFNLNGALNTMGIFMLTGGQVLSLSKGSFLLPIGVTGTQNSIVGNGKISGSIILMNPSAQLTWDASGAVEMNPVLSGGTFTLSKNLELAPKVIFSGPGVLNTRNYIVSIDMQGAAWTSPLTLNGTQGGIKLESNMILSNSFTCTGNLKIDGQGNSLDLSAQGSIVVASGATLNLKDITLKNVGGTNISCADSSARIIMQNVDIEFTNNFTFNNGSIEIFKQNRWRGPYTFKYSSSQPLTIDTQSLLNLDTNFVFNYAPVTNASNLFNFADKTSKLILNNASFIINANEISLTNGDIEVDGVSFISPLGLNEINLGITLGDGLSTTNDCRLFISNGSQLIISVGSLNYNNLLSDSLVMQNNLSSIYIATAATLNVYQTMNLGLGLIYFADQSTLNISSGATINGSVIPEGILYRN